MQSLEKRGEVSALLKQGNILKREGKLEEAAAVYRRCIEANPTSAWSYNNLGEVLAKEGKIENRKKQLKILRSFVELADLKAQVRFAKAILRESEITGL